MNYVTVLNSLYFPYLFALHKSLLRTHKDFRLWVIAMDSSLETALTSLKLEHLVVLPSKVLDDARLRELRESRSPAEFFWTVTPFLHEVVWRLSAEVDTVTYVDSDIYFLKDPHQLETDFIESGASVMITPHAFSPAFDASKESGYYCVQYIPANRSGASVLKWWQSACTGELGLPWINDQKFLDDWPRRFPETVHVLSRPELFQGPWNMGRYPYSDAVAFHFHGLRFKSSRRLWLGTNPIPRPTLQHVYRPYLEDLAVGKSLAQKMSLPMGISGHPMTRSFRGAVIGARLLRMVQSLQVGRTIQLPSGLDEP